MKRVFKRIEQGVHDLLCPLYRFAYRRSSEKNSIVLSESGATELVVLTALNNPAFVESVISKILNNPVFVEKLLEFKLPLMLEQNQRVWNDFFRNDPDELKKLQDRLIAGTDELSREVVARYIERCRFCMEYGNNPVVWAALQNTLLRQKYPLDYNEQQRIISLGKAYKCPYKLPLIYGEHTATDFSLNQFPLEVQKKVAGRDIIDGGGFSGDSAMIFTGYDPGRVYTFEPNPDTIPAMKQVLMENAAVLGDRKNRIEIVPLALGRSKGTLALYSSGRVFDAGATVLPAGRETKHEVDVISIDEFVEQRQLNVGLIKLDVEGAEYDTILGARETIIRQKPLLIISIYHTPRDFFEIKPLIESWGVGYKFEIRHHFPSCPDGDFMLLAY